MEEKKRNPILRPVAWVVLLILADLMRIAAVLMQRLGIFLVGLLAPLPTWAVVLLVITCSSIYLGIIGYAIVLLPSIVISITELIYPSKNAVRYYVVGVFGALIFCACIIGGMTGVIKSDVGAFWYYALCVYLTILFIVFTVYGKAKVDDRKDEIAKNIELEEKRQERSKTDETRMLRNQLSESERRNQIILEYSRKTCREIAGVPDNVEFDENYWPKSINGNSCMVYVDQSGLLYHKEDCEYKDTDNPISAFNLPENCSPCPYCKPLQFYGTPKWLDDYRNAISAKQKSGLIDPDIPR